MKSYVLNSETLNKVALARGAGSVADFLKCVYIWDEGKERFYMATNGHILFMAREERLEGDSLIEKPVALLYAGKVKALKNERPILKVENGAGMIVTSKAGVPVELLGVEPPDNWRSVIPGKDSPALTTYTCFNPDYLGRVNDFIGDYVFTRPLTANNDGLSPVVWYAENKVAVIMPRRLSSY